MLRREWLGWEHDWGVEVRENKHSNIVLPAGPNPKVFKSKVPAESKCAKSCPILQCWKIEAIVRLSRKCLSIQFIDFISSYICTARSYINYNSGGLNRATIALTHSSLKGSNIFWHTVNDTGEDFPTLFRIAHDVLLHHCESETNGFTWPPNSEPLNNWSKVPCPGTQRASQNELISNPYSWVPESKALTARPCYWRGFR